MRRFITLIALAFLLFAFFTPTAAAQEDNLADEKMFAMVPMIHLDFKNFFLYQNDRDFDRGKALYDENKQTVGYFATTLTPALTWNPIEEVTLQYTVQIGENLWSRNDAEQRNPAAADVPTFLHKEIWSSVRLPGDLFVQAGYKHVNDPTRLFLDRDIGAVTLGWMWDADAQWVRLSFGQIPDGVFENTTAELPASEFEQNNFENDVFVYAAESRLLAGSWSLNPAVFGLTDKSEIGREMNLLTSAFNAAGPAGPVALSFDIAGQWGLHRNGGIDNRDVDMAGYAAQVSARMMMQHFGWRLNLLGFSADDGDKNDLLDTGFTYSGFSRSSTVVLSENELQDQYDNLDERVAAQRAGLFLADLRLSAMPVPSLEFFVSGGYGRVLETKNLDDDATVGTEINGGVVWSMYHDIVDMTVLGGGVLPGKSGAMVKNEIDPEATDSIYYGQALMGVHF